MTPSEPLEMFVVGDIHVTIYREATDGQPEYTAFFDVGPGDGSRGLYRAEHLEDLATASDIDYKATELEDIRKRLKAREVPKRGFCWNCRKPLHARAGACAFCGETQ